MLKKDGKNTCVMFLITEDYQKIPTRSSELIRCLHQAVDHDYEGFDVYFQPIVDVNKNRSNTV